jgi:urea transport system permease protein
MTIDGSKSGTWLISRMILNRASLLTLTLVLGGAVLLAVLNLATDPAASLHVPTYVVALTGKYLCYAMLALAVDLVWGFAGILSLGHAAFFALGGHAMGMYLMRQIGARGVYGNANLPDFMVFLGWHELPWYWHGFEWFGFAALMVVLVPGLLALVFGWLAFRSRVTGVYLSIMTQALTYALLLAFFRNDMGFGGNNGMTDFKDLLGLPVQAEATRCALLVITVVFLCIQFLVARWLVTSGFGKVAVRDAEARTRFLGYRPESYKLVVWVLSAVMAGIGGRGGDLGRGRRPRHAIGRDPWRGAGQPGQDVFHQRAPVAVAVRAGCDLHLRHPVAAARHRRIVLQPRAGGDT